MRDENREEDRIDLPHDQVVEDNDGLAPPDNFNRNFNNTVNPPFGSFDEKTAVGTGVTPLRNDANSAEDIPAEAGRPFNADDLREETASEVAPTIRGDRTEGGIFRADETDNRVGDGETTEEVVGGTGLGWTALVLSIVSLFFLPILMATVGVVTGFFAYRNGARALGMWSIAIGLFSIVLGLFFTPFVR
jgi:hypothetical protein